MMDTISENAVAFNLLNMRNDPHRRSPDDRGPWARKIDERLAELQEAVDKLTPIVTEHFIGLGMRDG